MFHFDIPIQCNRCQKGSITNPCEHCGNRITSKWNHKLWDLFANYKVNGCSKPINGICRAGCFPCSYFEIEERVKVIGKRGKFLPQTFIVYGIGERVATVRTKIGDSLWGKFFFNIVKDITPNDVEYYDPELRWFRDWRGQRR